jgi:hypothetical protein
MIFYICGTFNALMVFEGDSMVRKVLTTVTVILLSFSLTAGAVQRQQRNAAKAEEISNCPGLLTNTTYYLNCADCGFYNLDLSNNQIEKYLQLWQPNTSYAQRYYLVEAGEGSYQIIKSQHDLNMHIIPDQSSSYNHVRIGGELNGTTDNWHIKPAATEGLYYIFSEYNNRALCSDSAADAKDQILMKEFTGNSDQQWRFIPVY